MITVSLVNTITSYSYKFFLLMVRTFKIYSLSNFQMYDAMLLMLSNKFFSLLKDASGSTV